MVNSKKDHEVSNKNYYVLSDEVIGDDLFHEEHRAIFKLKMIRNLLESAEDGQESSTAGFRLDHLREVKADLNKLIYLEENSRELVLNADIYDDRSSWLSEVNTSTIMKLNNVIDDVKREAKRIAKKTIIGVLPALAPPGTVFEERDGVYKYWREDENED